MSGVCADVWHIEEDEMPCLRAVDCGGRLEQARNEVQEDLCFVFLVFTNQGGSR